MKKSRKIWIGSLYLGATLWIAGCGGAHNADVSGVTDTSSTTTTTTTTTTTSSNHLVSCASGSYSVTGELAHCTYGSFEQVCSLYSGQLMTVSGTQVCKTTRYPYGAYSLVSIVSNYDVPRLTPSSPASSSSISTVLQVRRNDRLTVNVVGGWGSLTTQVSSCFWGLGSCTSISTSSCTQISGAGVDTSSSSALPANEGLPQGLLASDGVKAYYVGSNTPALIENDGTLRLGFNAPSGVPSGCANATVGQFSVTRCVDAAGNSFACP